MIDGMGSLCYDLVRTLSPFRYLPLPLYRLGKGRVDYLRELSRRSRWSYAKGVDTSYPHRKLTLFHTLPVDATAAITLAAGGEWLSETLDVLFGKRDLYPGAVVLKNRSAGDAFVWYSKLFIVSICHSVVRYNALAASAWQDGNEGRGSKEEKVIRYWLTLVSGLVLERKSKIDLDFKAATDSLPVIFTSCMIAGLFGNPFPFATSWAFILGQHFDAALNSLIPLRIDILFCASLGDLSLIIRDSLSLDSTEDGYL
ncbi:hypothetical protein Patl1_37613 [Pistacia atlantica]|nr:hypothetical protein Patl1_37613 [Pistacia atlantica]